MTYSDVMKERIRFTGFSQESSDILKEYLPDLLEILPNFLTLFYGQVVKWPKMASMFKDQSRMDYAKSAQMKHWIKLFSANFDEEYVTSVNKIGLIHSKIGLEPTWYIGAYNFTLNHIYKHATQKFRSRFNPDEAQRKTGLLISALNQCALIDMDMAISVYLEENKNSYNLKLNHLAQQFESSIQSIVSTLSTATTELEANASSLSKMAENTKSHTESVSRTSQDSASKVVIVSSATEEMSNSITQVVDMANKSSHASQMALEEASQSVHIMGELEESIKKISTVADLITGIAEQTNLLALNATIESARAGEAGKGFAVVANEVKALATQTAKATEEIRGQIAEILSRSSLAATSIEKVKNSIVEVRSISADTASSVEQQKFAISEIAENIESTAKGTKVISESIASISEAASETGHSAEQVQSATSELAVQSNTLKTAVNEFIGNIKAS